MNTKKIIIFDEKYDDLTINLQNNNVSVYDNEERVIKLYEPGPQGAKGDRGDTGLSGISEPFYSIITGSLYGVTASIAFQGQLSSSLVPYTTSYFNLGSDSFKWNNLYLFNSIVIQNTFITSESIGFEQPILSRINNTQQTFLIRSGSVSASFNEHGVFIISNFNQLPLPSIGGIILSGSEAYIGVL